MAPLPHESRRKRSRTIGRQIETKNSKEGGRSATERSLTKSPVPPDAERFALRA